MQEISCTPLQPCAPGNAARGKQPTTCQKPSILYFALRIRRTVELRTLSNTYDRKTHRPAERCSATSAPSAGKLALWVLESDRHAIPRGVNDNALSSW